MMSAVTGSAGGLDARLKQEIERRRTFAIISHPDAGKTTLTEKLLLFGGAIQLAGQVRARGESRRTRSDWMKIERDRGISVVTSVMTFEYGGHVFNLLDTPGHEDFSEDTYRTLTAVDSAIMVIDAAKGIEDRTRKLFEVCRLRDIPIVTFVNKLDREARDPFETLDEIEKTLALDTAPITWPVGSGKDFIGTYDLKRRVTRLMNEKGEEHGDEIDDAALDALLEKRYLSELREGIELAAEGTSAFDLTAFREGHLTPVYWGSALRNFGIKDLLDGLAAFAPPPRDQAASGRLVKADEPKMSAFVFKIQANMDPNHRDRIAFVRLCSGKLTRGMKVRHVRTQKTIGLHAPQFFFAQERQIADEAWAGDVVGIPNHGTLRIGDTLTEGEDITFVGVPSFAPEILRRVRLEDAMKAKKLKQALQELAEEGVVQVFRPVDGSPALVGFVGALQLDVLQNRLEQEYGLEVGFEPSQYNMARWLGGERQDVADFAAGNRSAMAEDVDGDPVLLATSGYAFNYIKEKWPKVRFTDVKEVQAKAAA